MRLMILACLAAAMPSTAIAQATQQGWSVVYRQDTFSGEVYSVGAVSESGDGFMKSNLLAACNDAGEIRFVFLPGNMPSSGPTNVHFRTGGETQEIVFSEAEMQHVGPQKASSAADSASLVEAFLEADNNPIPFRSSNKQGSFPSIGANHVLDIIGTNCAQSNPTD